MYIFINNYINVSHITVFFFKNKIKLSQTPTYHPYYNFFLNAVSKYCKSKAGQKPTRHQLNMKMLANAKATFKH